MTTTTVTKSNIIMGAASSFQVDGTDLGSTNGGVSVEVKITYQEIEVDQYLGAVDARPKKIEVTVSTKLAESTLNNLAMAWGQSAPTTNGSGNLELDVGDNTTVSSHELVFTGPGAGGKTRTFTFWQAINGVQNGKIEYTKDKEQVIPLDFKVLPDTTKPKAQAYFSVVDA